MLPDEDGRVETWKFDINSELVVKHTRSISAFFYIPPTVKIKLESVLGEVELSSVWTVLEARVEEISGGEAARGL